MTNPAHKSTMLRALILAPTGKDAALTADLLRRASIASTVCADVRSLRLAIRQGVGLLLVAEEALEDGGLSAMHREISRQPPWSDVPLLLFSKQGAGSLTVSRALQLFDSITLLERPVRPATLLTAVRAALNARVRQYQVREHIAEQARTEAALREADRRKDEFLATLAHELRNPLAPLRNAVHILQLTDRTEPARQQVYELMERQVDQLARLVDDLMEVSRITRGKIELRPEVLGIADVIRNAVEASRPLIDAAGHQLTISLPPEPLVVLGDPVRLSQVFSNLLNNAAKYMSPGGQIWITARTEGPMVVVSVRDKGIGIAPEMRPHLFKLFTQADRSKRQAQGGLGIGLTLVKTLVEMHGGQVEAISAGLDQGSEFVVRLPASPAAFGPVERSSTSTVEKLPKHRVLVVDDNRDAAVSLSNLLRLLGAEVQVAFNGPSALEKLKAFRPNVALLDIGMPGMDGYEVARCIRQDPDSHGITLIALTGWGQDQDRYRSHTAGFDHHLLKPPNLAALQSILISLPVQE